MDQQTEDTSGQTQTQTQTQSDTRTRTVPLPLLTAAMATPPVVAVLVHIQPIWGAMIANPGDVALGGAIFLTIVSVITALMPALFLTAEYETGGINREPDTVILTGFLPILAAAGFTAAGTLYAVHEPQHPLTGASIGMIGGGLAAILSSLSIALAESNMHEDRRKVELVRFGQLLSIASAAVVTVGILIICRSQLGL